MRVFACPGCGRLVTFQSTSCLHCGTALAFDPEVREIVALGTRSHCANVELAACNWIAGSPGALCVSCARTSVRPADDDPALFGEFAAAEAAKRRLFFALRELGLRADDRLTFEMLSSSDGPVTTGHADGVITLDLAEADSAERERRRLDLEEPYRTVLGTLRHEIGHYFQDILVPEGTAARETMRELFGDERASYDEALQRHYADGPPDDFAEHFVSAYATMHPWEDWAETFAHYLHMRDALQTAAARGLRVDGPAIRVTDEAPLAAEPVADGDLRTLLDAWFPLAYALNAMSRSLGARDLYPFVLAAPVQAKLAFVHDRIAAVSSASG